MAAESDAKAQLSETSSLRSRWLDGTNVKSAKETSEAVLVKAKPKVPPEGLLPSDPWEGKQLHPQESSLGHGGHGSHSDPWEKYHSAEPLSTEADIFAPRSRGTADVRKDRRLDRDPKDIPVMFGSRKAFPRPRGFGGSDERISHCMGKFLRYRSEELGRDEDGYVELPSLLDEIHDEVPWATAEDLRRVAQTSFSRHGKRFQTRDIQSAESGKVLTLVRATYKHADDFPRGRRKMMERMSGSGGFSASPTAEEAVRHFEMSPREDSEQRYDIEEQFAALHQDSPPAAASKEVAADVHGSCNAGATASEVSASTEATTSPQEEVWERFLEPVTLRVWFWNPKTEEVLYPDALEDGWEPFHTEEGQRWFWQETTGRYFFEETTDDK